MTNTWQSWERVGKPAAWVHLHRVAVSTNGAGRLVVFAVDTAGALWQIAQATPTNGWEPWVHLGKPTSEGISLNNPSTGHALAVKANHDGRLVAFAVASRAVWYAEQTDGGWSAWHALGEPAGSGGIVSLDVARNHDGRLQLFAITYTNRIASRRQTEPGGAWAAWDTDFPHDTAVPLKSLIAGEHEDGRLELLANVSDTVALVQQREPGGAFEAGFVASGLPVTTKELIGPATIARNPDGTLEAALTREGKLVHLRQRAYNKETQKNGWERQNVGRTPTRAYVRAPVLMPHPDGILGVFVQGEDGQLWHRRQAGPQGGWRDWDNLGIPEDAEDGLTAFDVGRHADGRLEAFAVHRGGLWRVGQEPAS